MAFLSETPPVSLGPCYHGAPPSAPGRWREPDRWRWVEERSLGSRPRPSSGVEGAADSRSVTTPRLHLLFSGAAPRQRPCWSRSVFTLFYRDRVDRARRLETSRLGRVPASPPESPDDPETLLLDPESVASGPGSCEARPTSPDRVAAEKCKWVGGSRVTSLDLPPPS